MLKLKKIAFVLSFIAVPFAMSANEAGTTSAVLQYEDCMYLNNVAYGNINPTFIKYLPIDAFATLELTRFWTENLESKEQDLLYNIGL